MNGHNFAVLIHHVLDYRSLDHHSCLLYLNNYFKNTFIINNDHFIFLCGFCEGWSRTSPAITVL